VKKFESSCINVRKHILKKGTRNKITEAEKKELIQNVYRPCYNQMRNVYDDREFIVTVPPNPWRDLEKYWQLKTEPEIRELFEDYTQELETWSMMWINFSNCFQHNRDKIGDAIAPAFEQCGLLVDGSINYGSDNSTPKNWLHNFQNVIFNNGIQNKLELYHILRKEAKRRWKDYEKPLEKWMRENPKIFDEILKLLPKLVKELGAKYSYQDIDTQRITLKSRVEEVTEALQKKLL